MRRFSLDLSGECGTMRYFKMKNTSSEVFSNTYLELKYLKVYFTVKTAHQDLLMILNVCLFTPLCINPEP